MKFKTSIASTTPTLVYFNAPWCAPCKIMKPIFEQVALELGNTINFLSIDVELKKKIARRYNVKSVPTFILFKNGESIWRQLGVLQKDDIKYAIAQFI